MKSIWLMISATLALTLLAGCKGDEPIEPTPDQTPELTLLDSTVEATAEGGHFEVSYTLENASEGAELRINAEHDWVTNIDISTEGVIAFDVVPSYEATERTCRLELIYPGVYPNPTISVKQAVGKEHSIKFELISAAATTITLNVKPKDETMPYVFILGNGEYIKSGDLMYNDEALWASDMEVFQSFADAFGSDIQMAVSAFMYEGEQIGHQFTGLTPGTSYVAYAYGFDRETMTPTTEISRLEITTTEVNDYTLHFDFGVEVNGPNVTIDITPQGYDGYYFYGVFWAEDVENVSDEEFRSLCEMEWERYKGLYAPFFDSTEEGLHFIFNELAYSGSTELEVELDANTEYVLWAFGMNDEALMNTTPERYTFTTGDVAASENEFTLSASDIYSRKLTVTVETTNDDTYIATFVEANRFESNSDAEIIEYILANFKLQYASGTMSDTATDLRPSTEYELLVFGCQAGAATTGLHRLKVTTRDIVYADLDFSLSVGNYYSGTELARLDSNYASYEGMVLVSITADVDPEAVAFYCSAMSAYDFPYIAYEDIIDGLQYEGAAEDSAALFLLEFDEPYTIFGVAEDRNGDFTELWSSKEYTFTEEGCSPAEEFFNRPAQQSAPASTVAASTMLSYE